MSKRIRIGPLIMIHHLVFGVEPAEEFGIWEESADAPQSMGRRDIV
jgi:hypothetical protein